MTNENEILTPDDSRFELPNVDDLYGIENSNTAQQVEENPINEPNDNSVSNIDPYNFKDPEDNTIDNGSENTNVELDALHQYLVSRGISDTKKIQYEDAEGNPTEVDFDSLSTEEQLNIITELSKPDISDEEFATIDYLRRNNMNLNQVIDYFANQRVQEYINNNAPATQTYSIDEYSDEELYLADLKSKYDFTDEELLSKLDEAKKNEALFTKEVSQLREFYKQEEEAQIEAQRQEEIYAQQQYTSALYDAANAFNEIALDYTDEASDTLEIENEDKQRSLSYLLDLDAEGKTQLMRDMENPEALIELAWLRTCGADALAGQSRYYKDIISDRNREIARLNKQIEKLKTSNSVVVPSEPKSASKNSSSPWDMSGLL